MIGSIAYNTEVWLNGRGGGGDIPSYHKQPLNDISIIKLAKFRNCPLDLINWVTRPFEKKFTIIVLLFNYWSWYLRSWESIQHILLFMIELLYFFGREILQYHVFLYTYYDVLLLMCEIYPEVQQPISDYKTALNYTIRLSISSIFIVRWTWLQ